MERKEHTDMLEKKASMEVEGSREAPEKINKVALLCAVVGSIISIIFGYGLWFIYVF
ncbi:putative polyol transporter 6 [Prunus yedoensis var. nudiflora]|uniref:Putative polyol transporter 6 n=1 Tax=Prunus yedoensis var. nudiflora TaxID=2094558 RepID=A0A314Y3L2_PRUYE|nr:putative polyol transporter 6 [Prunus yedoensis var. nudiflora]